MNVHQDALRLFKLECQAAHTAMQRGLALEDLLDPETTSAPEFSKSQLGQWSIKNLNHLYPVGEIEPPNPG